MAKRLFWLSGEEWARIEPYLPRGRRGARRVDDRWVISGIIHMLKTGARWRDCPAEYGPYTTIYNRFNRWSKQGVWEDVFYTLSGSSGVVSTTAVDSTHVKAHRSAAGAKGGTSGHRPLSRRTDDQNSRHSRPRRPPLAFTITAGQTMIWSARRR
jgi:transposase